VKFLLGGVKFGWQTSHMYREYDRKYW